MHLSTLVDYAQAWCVCFGIGIVGALPGGILGLLLGTPMSAFLISILFSGALAATILVGFLVYWEYLDTH